MLLAALLLPSYGGVRGDAVEYSSPRYLDATTERLSTAMRSDGEGEKYLGFEIVH